MEELIYEDPASAIVKARLFAEAILNEVFAQEDIKVPYISSLYDKISYLAKEGYITAEVQRTLIQFVLRGIKQHMMARLMILVQLLNYIKSCIILLFGYMKYIHLNN